MKAMRVDVVAILRLTASENNIEHHKHPDLMAGRLDPIKLAQAGCTDPSLRSASRVHASGAAATAIPRMCRIHP